MTLDLSKKNAVFPMICFVLLLNLTSCKNPGTTERENNGMWTIQDSWFHPSKLSHQVSSKVKGLAFFEVSSAEELQAETMLNLTSVVPVTLLQAKDLTGGSYQNSMNSPYLVRAVYLNKGTGGFTVSVVGSDLFIDHSSLGHSAVPMKRQALIVDLSEIPKNVYTNCGMAE